MQCGSNAVVLERPVGEILGLPSLDGTCIAEAFVGFSIALSGVCRQTRGKGVGRLS